MPNAAGTKSVTNLFTSISWLLPPL